MVAPGASGIGLLSRQDLASRDAVLQVLESPALYRLMEGLLQVRRWVPFLTSRLWRFTA